MWGKQYKSLLHPSTDEICIQSRESFRQTGSQVRPWGWGGGAGLNGRSRIHTRGAPGRGLEWQRNCPTCRLQPRNCHCAQPTMRLDDYGRQSSFHGPIETV
jgi:hypothetical protein